MYKLAIIHKGKIEKNVHLINGKMLIGRKPVCSIHLEEKMVSGQHAELSVSDSGVILKDLDSTNGTTVNGNHITETALQTGDQISIGNYKMIFVREHGETEDPDATMIVGGAPANQRPPAIKPEKKSATLMIVISVVIVAIIGITAYLFLGP